VWTGLLAQQQEEERHDDDESGHPEDDGDQIKRGAGSGSQWEAVPCLPLGAAASSLILAGLSCVGRCGAPSVDWERLAALCHM
jgi:hypothetical protein